MTGAPGRSRGLARARACSAGRANRSNNPLSALMSTQVAAPTPQSPQAPV